MHIYGTQKNVIEDFFTGQQWRDRHREQLYGNGERKGEGEMYEKINMDTTLPYVKQPTGICQMAQETQTGTLYRSRGMGWGRRWEGDSKRRGYMYTYGCFMLRFDRKQNSVKQLSFNKKEILKNDKKKKNVKCIKKESGILNGPS